MDLPFAVDSSPERRTSTSLNHSNASSLVTASSQGSLLPVDSPDHSGMYSSPDNSLSNTIISPHSAEELIPGAADADLHDFTYVNVFETDADEVDVLMDGKVPIPIDAPARGDVLAVLLSGGTQEEQAGGESIVALCEKANEAASNAAEAKRKGDLTSALNAHSEAAKVFRQTAVRAREGDGTFVLIVETLHTTSTCVATETQSHCSLSLSFLVQFTVAVEPSSGEISACT